MSVLILYMCSFGGEVQGFRFIHEDTSNLPKQLILALHVLATPKWAIEANSRETLTPWVFLISTLALKIMALHLTPGMPFSKQVFHTRWVMPLRLAEQRGPVRRMHHWNWVGANLSQYCHILMGRRNLPRNLQRERERESEPLYFLWILFSSFRESLVQKLSLTLLYGRKGGVEV